MNYLNNRTQRDVSQDQSIELSNVNGLTSTIERPRVCPSENTSLTISGRFELDTLRDYQNIFQTAPLNTGIRMEVDSRGRSAVILGSPLGLYEALPLRETLNVGQQYSLEITWSKNGQVEIHLDKQMQRQTDKIPSPLCTDIRVGTGFDDTRNVDGRATVRFTSTAYKRVQVIPHELIQLLVVLVIALFALQQGRYSKKKD